MYGTSDREAIRQLTDQVSRIAGDIAALKQQIADQQHGIDQIRQDTAAAINTGLAEIRQVAREATNRATDTVTGRLANIGTELVAIRGGVTQLDGQLKARTPEQARARMEDSAIEPAPEEQPESAPSIGAAPNPEPQPDLEQEAPVPDPGILRAAAGIAHATIEAHRDTWAFLLQVAGNEQHFHIPGKVNDDDGFVGARISGPSLVAAITSLDRVAQASDSDVTRAIAEHIHGKIIRAVQAVIDRPRTNSDGTPFRIVIDDQAQADDESAGDEE